MPKARAGDTFATNHGALIVHKISHQGAKIQLDGQKRYVPKGKRGLTLPDGAVIKVFDRQKKGGLCLEFDKGMRGLRSPECLFLQSSDHVKTLPQRMLAFLQHCYLNADITDVKISNDTADQLETRLFVNFADEYKGYKRRADRIIAQLRENRFEAAMASAKNWVNEQTNTRTAGAPYIPGIAAPPQPR